MWQCPKCERKFKSENQSHYCGNVTTIDQYISEQPEELQKLLSQIRQTIHAAAPNAEERISWQMPTFWQGENLIHFAVSSKHIGLYPGGEATVVFAERLKDYSYSKGTIRLPLDKPIDFDLIADITRWRVEQVEEKDKNAAKLHEN
ncbi:MAG: DUF1801 domain-containing protein [Oscillospiraceae bacterium]|jgi:uncharacterized protein YdhG (YjbR/CyaY superfamily)|nr:DUF1801 domain-containing protein [Oscillospiraceae bacterium]